MTKIALDRISRNYKKCLEHKWIASSYRRISHRSLKIRSASHIRGYTIPYGFFRLSLTRTFAANIRGERSLVVINSCHYNDHSLKWRKLTPRIHERSRLFVAFAVYSRIRCNLPFLLSHSSALMATTFQRPGRSAFKRIIYWVCPRSI